MFAAAYLILMLLIVGALINQELEANKISRNSKS